MQHPSRPSPARSPLGAVYAGKCTLDVTSPPDADHLYDFCNTGYARGHCSRFPSAAEADAVRFSMHRNKLLYVLEKDHAPVRHGEAAATDGVLRAQADVFSENLSR